MDWFDRFCAYFPTPSWSDLVFGLERGLYASNRIILFAGDYLLEHPGEESDNLLELAVASPIEHAGVVQALQRLSSNELADIRDKAARRWRYLFLLDVTHASLSPQALLEKVESIWCEFGHPADMNKFIGWMPPDPGEPSVSPGKWKDWAMQQFREFMVREREELT